MKATRTNENNLIINHENSILIGEASHEVCIGIKEMIKKLNHFSSDKIRASSRDHEGSQIVDDLYIYLKNIK